LRLVGRRGFEPLISALRGRCPGPLDERPTCEGKRTRRPERVRSTMLPNTPTGCNLPTRRPSAGTTGLTPFRLFREWRHTQYPGPAACPVRQLVRSRSFYVSPLDVGGYSVTTNSPCIVKLCPGKVQTYS
jgi:hypothetical protein